MTDQTHDPADAAAAAWPPVFDNSYARELAGLYAPWEPATVPAPVLLRLNDSLARELGWPPEMIGGADGAGFFSGNRTLPGTRPLAQAYAGHQFGGYSPQLGDGRALLLGEVLDQHGHRRDIAFKGSGRTPFSRGGDGKAALGPVLREYLIGEAMHALDIPTTRALAVVGTGESVYRDAGTLPGAVLTRVAASHIRVGTFQWVASRGDVDLLRRFADYVIARHDPDLAGQPGRHLGLLEAVARRQAHLVARWMGVGFIHGVMNTDNMTISGETIDYGPCAFMDAYDPATVYSSIDHGGRYAYGNQPHIARWNLARLAEALLPLMVDGSPDDEARVQAAVAQATAVIDAFPDAYRQAWLSVMRGKLGLEGEDRGDEALVQEWLDLLAHRQADFTLTFRGLADAVEDPNGAGLAMLGAVLDGAPGWPDWWSRWTARAKTQDGVAGLAGRLRAANPRFIARNLRVEEALAAATDNGDLGPFERLLAVLQHPFDEQTDAGVYAEAPQASQMAGYRTFCGT
ncbi:MAG: YdiU family protein [Burkholderiaceae bacterium]